MTEDQDGPMPWWVPLALLVTSIVLWSLLIYGVSAGIRWCAP